MDGSILRKTAFAMPPTSPAFPPGPYRFANLWVRATMRRGLAKSQAAA